MITCAEKSEGKLIGLPKAGFLSPYLNQLNKSLPAPSFGGDKPDQPHFPELIQRLSHGMRLDPRSGPFFVVSRGPRFCTAYTFGSFHHG
jgi:hypothetical protein